MVCTRPPYSKTRASLRISRGSVGWYINFDKIRGYISEEDDALFSQKYRPQLHDVYMIKSGVTGITAIVETDTFNIWSPLAVMRSKSSYNPYFLINYLRSDSFQNLFNKTDIWNSTKILDEYFREFKRLLPAA